MGIAAAAQRFSPHGKPAAIFLRRDGVGIDWLPETRTAGAGIELGRGFKQRLAAADAHVGAWLFRIPVLAGKGALGALLASHTKLFVGKLLPPLGIGLGDFFLRHDSLTFPAMLRRRPW